MHSSKKIVLHGIIVFTLVVAVSLILSLFIPHTERDQRNSYAGSLDCIIVGASQAECAFIPEVIDPILGCSSYNISVSSMTTADRYLLLEKEINRNPVKTVILELSYNALARPVKNDAADGNFHMVSLMDTFTERTNYLIKHTPIDNWPYVYARSILTAGQTFISSILGQSEDTTQKGFTAYASKDYTLSGDNIEKEHNQLTISTSVFLPESILELDKMVLLCKEHNIEVIITVVPVADSYIWRYKNLDDFRLWLEVYCKKENIAWYDFNLNKNRYELFSDKESFGTNNDHMSESGAYAFSKLFAETINDVRNKKTSANMFYSSYKDLVLDSPYVTTN